MSAAAGRAGAGASPDAGPAGGIAAPALAGHQRRLLEMLRRGAGAEAGDEPYLHAVAGSTHLDLLREVILWWRCVGIRRACPLTGRLLDRLGTFDEVVGEFVAEWKISPFVERLGAEFLAWAARRPEPLVASLAAFEHALLSAKAGDPAERTVDWRHPPEEVLAAILLGADLPAEDGPWHTVVSADRRGLFEVVPAPSE